MTDGHQDAMQASDHVNVRERVVSWAETSA